MCGLRRVRAGVPHHRLIIVSACTTDFMHAAGDLVEDGRWAASGRCGGGVHRPDLPAAEDAERDGDWVDVAVDVAVGVAVGVGQRVPVVVSGQSRLR